MPRPTCSQCLRPLSRCWCDLIAPIETSLRVRIFQHPDEHKHSKNSGRLLAHCLDNCQLMPWRALQSGEFGEAPALLYPALNDGSAEAGDSITDLIILDATWRKARAAVLQYEHLRQLPRLSLNSPPIAPNQIRSSTVAHARSTYSATVEALAQINALQTPIDQALVPYLAWQQRIINDRLPPS